MMSPSSGSIVKDNESLLFEQELKKLMDQYPNYYKYQESGYKDASRFTCDTFYCQWDKIIKSLL